MGIDEVYYGEYDIKESNGNQNKVVAHLLGVHAVKNQRLTTVHLDPCTVCLSIFLHLFFCCCYFLFVVVAVAV